MKKRFLAIFIVVLMLFSQITVFATDLNSSTTSINPEDKLTDELKEVMNNIADDEYIPVYIWLNEYEDEIVYTLLSNELGTTITAETESNYIQAQIKSKIEKINKNETPVNEQSSKFIENNLTNVQKAQQLINEVNISNVMSESEIEKCIETGMSYEEIVKISEETHYLSKWREKREHLNKSLNSTFEGKLDTRNCKNIYFDSLLSYVTLECKKSYIYNLTKLNEVDEIGYYTQTEDILDVLDETTSSNYSTTGYHMTEKEGISYNAAGIKIGVIEVPETFSDDNGNILTTKGVYYDTSNVHLSGKTSSQLITNYSLLDNVATANRGISDHATTVLNIICGNEATRTDGVKYKGIAPNATVYYVNYSCTNGFEKAISWCLKNNVSVINMSFGSVWGYYHTRDRYVDCIIEQYRVSIVKSAGNYSSKNNPNSLVTSPGLAYNVITVGNMNWETNSDGQQQLSTSSCFQNETYLTNKPDISAFGTDIYTLNSSGIPERRGSGTSYAAPMVTGTIALMMKENSNLIGRPDAVKSILLTTASSNNISNTIRQTNQNNYVAGATSNASNVNTTSVLRNGSGAGLLNIEGAIATSGTNLLERYAFYEGTAVVTGGYYFSANQKIKLSLVFEKFDYNSIDSMSDINTDWDILIINSSGYLVASSSSAINNVEILECEFQESGYYEIIISNSRFPTYDELSSSYTIYDENGDSLNAYPSGYCYASLLFVCDCNASELSVNCSGGTTHNISCNNCSFVCQEKHSVETYVVDNSYATVEYKVYYTFKNSIYGLGFQDRICHQILEPTVTPKNSSYTGRAIIETGSSQYEPDGSTIETRTYWILILDSEGAIVTSWYSTVRITYDLAFGVYYINGG